MVGLMQAEKITLFDRETTLYRHYPLVVSFDELACVPSLHCRGFMHPKIEKVLKALLATIQAQSLLVPAASYGIIKVEQVTANVLRLVDGTELAGPQLLHKLKTASMVMATTTTLNSGMSDLIEQAFSNGEKLKAVLVEEIANFALFKLNEQLMEVAIDEAGKRGLMSSGPLCPGNDGFDLHQQKNMLKLAGAGHLGVELMPLDMMKPRHSHTQLAGFGKRMKSWGYADKCDVCKARDRCQYLRTSVPTWMQYSSIHHQLVNT